MSVALKTAPGHRLRADAAAAFDAANARRRWVLTDSERPLATQVRIFLERYIPARTGGGYYGDIRWWNGVRYVRKKGHAAAAVPGTSNHGAGTAIDVTGLGHIGSATWEAFRADVEPHGWRHPAWAKNPTSYEPWHWEYHPTLDTRPVSRPGGGTGSISTPTIPGRPAPLTPEDDMTPTQATQLALTLEHTTENRRMLGVLLGYNTPANATERDALARLWGEGTEATEARRMLGVLLGWQPGQGPEADALARLTTAATIDAADIAAAIPTDLAQAVVDQLADRLTGKD